MPNRLIKESICTSENIDNLSLFEETVFYRLIVNCDDFGRFDARLSLLCSKLFPLRRNITEDQMKDALDALQRNDLITLYTVNGRPYLCMNKWKDHQQVRSDKSKYPAPEDKDDDTQNQSDDNQNPSDDINGYQMISNDINGNQTITDDIKCPRYSLLDTRNTILDTRETEEAAPAPACEDDDLRKIAKDHDCIFDAAEEAGFKMSNAVRTKLVGLYEIHGLEKVLAGIDSCVQHGAMTLAYLAGCMNDKPKKEAKRPEKTVSAQNYQQRDYSDADSEQWAMMMSLDNRNPDGTPMEGTG